MIYKRLIAQDGNGNLAQGAILGVYEVTFTFAGIPIKGALVDTMTDVNGDPIDQDAEPLVSGPDGKFEFILPAGVYWVEIVRGPVTDAYKRFQVGDAAERAVGVGAGELPLGAQLIESLTGAAPVSGDVGKVLRYGSSGPELAFPDPAPAFPVEALSGGLSTSWLGRMLTVVAGTTPTVTLPAEAGLSFPVGRSLMFLVQGTPSSAATLTFAPGAGATINGGSDSWICDTEFGVVTAFKTGANAWAVQGCERVV